MPHLTQPAFLIALMLLTAIVAGYAGTLARLPRVVGYLAGGVLLHIVLAGFQEPTRPGHTTVMTISAAADQLHGLKTLALGLIMFVMGSVFEANHIGSVAPRMLRISFTKMLAVLILVAPACGLIASLQGIADQGTAAAFGLLLGIVAIATAPAATFMVLREYEAKGSNSDAILTMTALNNIACIILFHLAFFTLAASGAIESAYGTERWLWFDVLCTSVGSVALGVGLGFGLGVLYRKLTAADVLLIFLGIVLLLGTTRDYLANEWHLSFNFLLTCLLVGATFTNITPGPEAFYGALRSISGPIFALFFVLAGFELHVGELSQIGLLGLAYVVLRTAGKSLGGWLGLRWMPHHGDLVPFLGAGMLCQAGVAIGLADFLANNWGTSVGGEFTPAPAARAFETAILGSIVIFEVLGPVSLKRVVISAGEVKAVTLIHRRRTPGNETESVVRRAWESLLRTLNITRSAGLAAVRGLRVRHIMRANVKVLPASATFDEVLHFVEGSRHNHFPVVDDIGQYIGMIHYGDLRNLMYAPALRDLITAHDLCRQTTAVTTLDAQLGELLNAFHEIDIGCLAVVDNPQSRHVIGIVEQRDLLIAMHRDQASAGPA